MRTRRRSGRRTGGDPGESEDHTPRMATSREMNQTHGSAVEPEAERSATAIVPHGQRSARRRQATRVALGARTGALHVVAIADK